MARTTRHGRIGWIVASVLMTAPLFAQDGSGGLPGLLDGLGGGSGGGQGGSSGTVEESKGGLPRDTVKSGGLANRRPGLRIQAALRGTPEITQTAEERDAPRPRADRKFSVQILLSILDGLQQAIIQSFGQLLPSLLGNSLPTGSLQGGLSNDLFNQMLGGLLANNGNATTNPVPTDPAPTGSGGP